MHTLSRWAGALVLPVLLAGCTGVPAVVEPAPVAATPVPAAPVALSPVVPVQTVPVAPAAPVVAYGAHCYAGFYQCDLPVSGPLGSQCTCPGLGGPSYGTIR